MFFHGPVFDIFKRPDPEKYVFQIKMLLTTRNLVKKSANIYIYIFLHLMKIQSNKVVF